MVAGVRVSFGVVRDEVEPTLKKQNKGYQVQKSTIGQIQGSYKVLEREALRYLKRAADETTKLARVQLGLNRLVEQGVITRRAANRALGKAREEISGQDRLSKRVASSVRSTVASYVSIGAAIGVANSLLREQVELQDKLARRTLSVGDAEAQLIANLGFDAPIERQREFVASIGPLSRELGLDRARLTTAVAQTFSATSGEFESRAEETLDTIRAVAPFFRGRQEEIGTFAGVIQDASRTFAREGIGLSRQETTALLLQAQSQLRITDIANLKNVVPAIAAVDVTSDAASIDDGIAALAALGAVGGRTGDITGELTRTAVANLAAVLREELPGTSSFAERLRLVQQDEALQARVIPALRGRGAIKPTVEELITGGTAAGAFEAIRQNLTLDPERLEEQKNLIEAGTLSLRARTDLERTLAATEEALAGTPQGRIGLARQLLFTGEGDRPGAFALSSATDRLFQRAIFETLAFVGAGEFAALRATSPTAEQDAALTEALTGVREILLEQKALQEQQLAEQQAQNGTGDQATVQPPETGN